MLVNIGQYNTLKVLKKSPYGLFLDGDEDGEILLPNRDVPENAQVGDELDVFICYDSEDRLVATTVTPKAQVGQFATLKVKSIEKVGAFLDWGLPKDLFLPFSEMSREVRPGYDVVVALYLDKSDRISASMRFERFLDKEAGEYQEDQEVQLLVAARTDLGYKCIINGRHLGMLYANEVFKNLGYGQTVKGYIKNLRPDGKVDLMLAKTGHQGAEDIGPKIVEMLKARDGFLPLTDKTDPEKIYNLFGVSKKKYKIAVGGLYKKKWITIAEDGIRLTEKALKQNS